MGKCRVKFTSEIHDFGGYGVYEVSDGSIGVGI